MKKIIVFTFMILMLLAVNVKGEAPPDNPEIDMQKIENLYDYINNMKSEYDIIKDIDVREYINSSLEKGNGAINLNNLIKYSVSYIFRETQSVLKMVIMVIVIGLLCSLLNNLQGAFSNENITNIAFYACYALLIVILTKSFFIGVDVVKNTISDLNNFMQVLTPVLLMLLVSLGGFAEAATLDPIMASVLMISSKIIIAVILPVISINLLLKFVNNLSEDYKVENLASLVGKFTVWFQGILLTIFVGFITIRGFTSKAFDQVGIKTAKYAVDNFIPIVGKAFSDAVSTVASYSYLLKSSISSLGLLLIVVILITPAIKIIVMALMYKLAAALLEPINEKRLVNCISSVGDSLILMLSTLISVSVMFFIVISIIASAGSSALRV